MHRANRSPSLSLSALVLLLAGCAPEGQALRPQLREDLDARIAAEGLGPDLEVGLYYRSMGRPDSVLIDSDVRMHAASTMKVPVMLQLYLDAEEGTIDLDAPINVTTTFTSILDGSEYILDQASDSDQSLYDQVGEPVSARHLMDRMITWSSNLATNLLIRDADAQRVTRTMRALGADSIEVLRGVEDIPAFEAGLSNTTTARDLGILMAALARGDTASDVSRQEMIGILERQQFRSKIPAGVPEGTRVANKTGGITGIHHDAAIIYPEDGPAYVLVVLIRGLPGEGERADALAADLSRRIWEFDASRR